MNTNQMHFNTEYAARSEFEKPLVVSALTAAIEASCDGDDISLELGSFPAVAGPPAFVTVSRAEADLTAELAGEETVFSGAQDISPAVPLSGGFDLPTLTAPVPAGYTGGEVSVTGLTVKMTVMNSATPITCTLDEPVSFDMPARPCRRSSRAATTPGRCPSTARWRWPRTAPACRSRWVATSPASQASRRS